MEKQSSFIFLFILTILCRNTFSQGISTIEKNVLYNQKIINLAIFEKNTLKSKVVDNGYHLIKYDSLGNPLSVTVKQTGTVEQKFKYDDVGRLIEMQYGNTFHYAYGDNGTLDFIVIKESGLINEKFLYDSNNNQLQHFKRNKLDKLSLYIESAFFNNREVERKMFNIDSELLYAHSIFVYNEFGEILEEVYSSYNKGNLWFTTIYKNTYNTNNRKVLSQVYSVHPTQKVNELISETRFEYNHDGKLISKTEQRNQVNERKSISFKYNGNLLIEEKVEYFNIEKNTIKQIFYIRYIYDVYGNVTDVIYLDDKYVEEERVRYKYLYLK